MVEYRVSKYEPARRDAGGVYRRDEWTARSDVGRMFEGVVLTAEEYRRVEDAYVDTAVRFWRDVGRPALVVRGLEDPSGTADVFEGGTVDDERRLADVIRRALREELWCRLEADACFVHFGWDYYLYVGVSDACAGACAFAAASGLFVESFVSPHHPAAAP